MDFSVNRMDFYEQSNNNKKEIRFSKSFKVLSFI